MGLIKSISYDQAEIIRSILLLHVPSRKIDCDPTYSKGFFTGAQEFRFHVIGMTSSLRRMVWRKRTREASRCRTVPLAA